MVRGALVAIAVALLGALASAQTQFGTRHGNNFARSWLRARLEEEDHKPGLIANQNGFRSSSHNSRPDTRSHHHSSGESSNIAASIAHQISSSGYWPMPIPHTKKFYLTFGPYYVEDPVQEYRMSGVRQMDEIDSTPMGVGSRKQFDVDLSAMGFGR